MGKLIEVEKFKKDLLENYAFIGFPDLLRDFCVALDSQPPVDAAPVVRCKDCRWHNDQNGATWWMPCREMKTPNDYYCASGERKDGNDD